jgi:hypothetical protein
VSCASPATALLATATTATASYCTATTGTATTGTASVATVVQLPHCSIELLYYRTSVPSNERLVREANVTATVAERGGKTRTIRNQGPRDARHRRPQPNPRTPRPSHLRLVADHGQMVDPDFQPGRPVWVSGTWASGTAVPAHPAHPGAPAGRARMRLTRRGRLMLTSAAVLLIGVASMVLASAIQAAAHP